MSEKSFWPHSGHVKPVLGSLLTGCTTEAAVAAFCAGYGFVPLSPKFNDNLPYDFVLNYGTSGMLAARVQVKTSMFKSTFTEKGKTLEDCIRDNERYYESLYISICKENGSKDSDKEKDRKKALKAPYTHLDCDVIMTVWNGRIYAFPISFIEKSGNTSSINFLIRIENGHIRCKGRKPSKYRLEQFRAEDYLMYLLERCNMEYSSRVNKKARELKRDLSNFNCAPLSC